MSDRPNGGNSRPRRGREVFLKTTSPPLKPPRHGHERRVGAEVLEAALRDRVEVAKIRTCREKLGHSRSRILLVGRLAEPFAESHRCGRVEEADPHISAVGLHGDSGGKRHAAFDEPYPDCEELLIELERVERQIDVGQRVIWSTRCHR